MYEPRDEPEDAVDNEQWLYDIRDGREMFEGKPLKFGDYERLLGLSVIGEDGQVVKNVIAARVDMVLVRERCTSCCRVGERVIHGCFRFVERPKTVAQGQVRGFGYTITEKEKG